MKKYRNTFCKSCLGTPASNGQLFFFPFLSTTSVCCANASQAQMVTQHFIKVSGKYCEREKKTVFQEMFLVAGGDSEVLYVEAIRF